MKARKLWLRYGITLTLLALVAVFVWRNWSNFSDSLNALSSISWSTFVWAIGLLFLTFLFASISYRLLSFKQLRFSELYLVELASAFINRLVPSGVGGFGTHGLYLYRRGHTVPQATAVVSVNNLLSLSTHLLMLAVVVLALGANAEIRFTWSSVYGWIVLGVVVLLGILFLVRPVRRKTVSFLRNLAVSLGRYKRHPRSLALAGLVLVLLTLTNVYILHLMASAVGIDLAFTKLFVVYSAGVLVGAAVPTPGGLAGTEAGLAGGFIAYGVSSELAIAAALAFRLVVYWFPLIPGACTGSRSYQERLQPS